jgi:hypothetical protein
MLTREQIIANIEAMEKQGAQQGEIQEWLDTLPKPDSIPTQPDIVPQPVEQEGAPFTLFPATGKEGYLEQAGKTIGNIPGSTLNFAKNIVEAPKNIFDSIKSIPQEFKNLVNDSGGDVGKAVERTITEMPHTAYKMFMPQFARSIINGDYQGAQKVLAEDPVGQIAPLLLGAKAIAEKAGAGAQFNQVMETIAKPVIAPAKSIGSVAEKTISGSSKFVISQATGLNPQTISTTLKNPQELGNAIKQGINREVIAGQVKGAIESRLKDLSETGKGYEAMRQSGTMVKVPSDLISQTLKKFGLSLDKNGNIKSTIESRPISNADKIALEGFVKTFGNKKNLSTNAFFNAREALTNLSKFEQGKTQIPQLIAKELRKAYDNAGKSQIKGLGTLDKTYSSERTLLNLIKKDYLEKNTVGGIKLKDSAINKISNATGIGKDALLSRLEKLVPGIEKQIKLVKVIEDIENSGGQKVGTYARAAGIGAGAITLNPYLIVGSILSIPEIAVPLLRGVGYSAAKIKSTMDVLGIPLKELNKLPDTITSGLAPK